MKRRMVKAGCLLMIVAGVAACGEALQAQTPGPISKPAEQFVTVEPNVKLEVLDWGGTGRPLVFLWPRRYGACLRRVRAPLHRALPRLRNHTARVRRFQQARPDRCELLG